MTVKTYAFTSNDYVAIQQGLGKYRFCAKFIDANRGQALVESLQGHIIEATRTPHSETFEVSLSDNEAMIIQDALEYEIGWCTLSKHIHRGSDFEGYRDCMDEDIARCLVTLFKVHLALLRQPRPGF